MSCPKLAEVGILHREGTDDLHKNPLRGLTGRPGTAVPQPTPRAVSRQSRLVRPSAEAEKSDETRLLPGTVSGRQREPESLAKSTSWFAVENIGRCARPLSHELG